MLRNHFLLNSFLSQDSFFKDLHCGSHTFINLIYEQGRVLLQSVRGLKLHSGGGGKKWHAARVEDNTRSLKSARRLESRLLVHSFRIYWRDIVGQKNHLYTLPASDVMKASVDITQNSLRVPVARNSLSVPLKWVRPSALRGLDTQSRASLSDYGKQRRKCNTIVPSLELGFSSNYKKQPYYYFFIMSEKFLDHI